jgi:5-methyltetrahydropteroyltriglutamate--homocysteine methyltransferase
MKHSIDRILTTHAGSLPRPPDLLELIQTGGPKVFDQGGNAARLRKAVSEVVHKQAELGIDVIDDGEYGKPSFVSYINERLGGYEVDTVAGPRNQWMTSREGAVVSGILCADPPGFDAHAHDLHRADYL